MSITINGTAYDVSYVNVASDFAEQPGATLEIDPWGMDTITRRFTGRLDKVETELAKYEAKRDKRDAIYPDLFAVKWSMTHESPFPVLEVTFRGVKGGKPRDPKPKTGRRVQTVTLPFTDEDGNKDGTTATLKYYTPFATFLYATRSKPVGAKYKSLLDISQIETISTTGDDEREVHYKRGPSLNGVTGSSTVFRPVANSYNGMVEVTGTVESEPVGQWWENTETIEAIIVPLGLTQAKRRVSV